MVAHNSFSGMDENKLKMLISEGSIEAMRYFGEQSTALPRTSRAELEQRKQFLFEAPHHGHSHILGYVAILAAMTEDLEMAKFIIPLLEEVGDPSLGYYAFREIEHHNLPEEEENKWRDFLASSAKHGHILARRYCLDKRMEQFGVLGKLFGLPMKIVLMFSGLRILLSNSDDFRLPPPRSK